MRLTSDMFISALTRRIYNDGGHAVIAQTGAKEAGAIFIRLIHRDRKESLYAPAPQALISDDQEQSERYFELRLKQAAPFEIDEIIARERKFDHDIWVIDIETDRAEDYFSIIF